mgnify:FL=1
MAPAVPGEKGESASMAAVVFPANGELELPGLISSVPEFHDCQRFIVQDDSTGAERYAGLMAIFARYGLDAAFYSATNHSTVIQKQGLWVAQVAAEEDYAPLDIARGFNCLALRLVGKDYWAMMVARHTESTCGPLPTDSAWEQRRSTLPVDDIPAGNQAAVPAVARWDWDELNGRQYIGIHCGTAWCEVHSRDGFQSSPTHAIAGGTADQRMLVNVKGWYDSQRLARRTPGGRPEDLTPTALRSSVYPFPNLDRRRRHDYQGRWLPAAYITMPRLANYEKKMNLAAVADPPVLAATGTDGARNVISLCYGTAGACKIGDRRVAQCHMGDNPPSDTGWFARITQPATATRPARPGVPGARSSGDGDKEFCVKFRPFPMVPPGMAPFTVPGVVRWRWKARDETVWIECPSGCCEVVVDEM